MNSRVLNFLKFCILLSLILGVSMACLLLFGGTNKRVEETYAENFEFQHLSLSDDGSQEYNASNAYNKYDNITLKDFDVKTDTEYYVVIAFVNFASGAQDWTQSDIDEIMQSFNDETDNNDVYSVKEYMRDQSYGKINLTATYVEYTTGYTYDDLNNRSTAGAGANQAFIDEGGIYDSALRNKTIAVDGKTITTFHCRILYFPCNSGEYGSMLWPHAWMGQALIVTPEAINHRSGPFVGTYCHELTHVLGVPDLYSSDNSSDALGSWYLMASTDYYHPQTINAYYKSLLEFADVSHYYDDKSSKIEEVTSKGEYSLSPATSLNGTIAFKFGGKDTTVKVTDPKHYGNQSAKEYFMVEYKSKSASSSQPDYSIPGTGLIVYRVVECDYLLENGNLYPNYTNAKYQVYAFRPRGLDIEDSALGTNESYGSLTNSLSKVLLTYSDGTNSKIKIENLGTNASGQVRVKFDFEQNLYSIKGSLKYNGVNVGGARVFKSSYNSENGTYNAPVDTGVVTDANGKFFVLNLEDKTKITFVKDGMTITESLTVDGKNVDGVVVDENNSKEVTIKIYNEVGNERLPVVGAVVYKNSAPCGVTDDNGEIAVELKKGDTLEFESDIYEIPSFTYNDFSKNYFEIRAWDGALSAQNVQLLITNSELSSIDGIQLIDVSSPSNPLVVPYIKNDKLLTFDAYEGMRVKVEFSGYAPTEFTVVSKDLIDIREIALQKYKSTKITIKANNPDGLQFNLQDMTVKVDGIYVGVTNTNGVIEIDQIYNGQIITFEHEIYKVDDLTFDGSADISLRAQFKTVEVLVQFYRPQVEGDENYDPNNNIVLPNNLNLTIRVGGSIKHFANNGNMLSFETTFYDSVTFVSDIYAITDEEGKILREEGKDSAHNYEALIINPEIGELKNGKLTINLYAKKYITISGKVEFPENAKVKIVSISINHKDVSRTTTDEEGNFTLEALVEGDEIFFKCAGYEFEKFFVMDSPDNANLIIKAEEAKKPNYIFLYILFGVLGLCFVIPFFIGVRTKKKTRLKQI